MLLMNKKGSWISLDAEFNSIPLFPHGISGIYISGGVSIGHNCTIFQQVTIGSNSLLDSSGLGAPRIGDNCYIGAGAKIIGNVNIGKNVRIGANAVVVKDVPDNSVVVPCEQRIIIKEKILNNRFYQRNNGKWRFYENGSWHFVLDPEELKLLDSRFPIHS